MSSLAINPQMIRDIIRDKHKKFLESFSATADKALADQKYLANMLKSRIMCILDIFKDEHIIDEIVVSNGSLVQKFVLKKNESLHDTIIEVRENTITIRHESSVSALLHDTVLYMASNVASFSSDDWTNFSKELLTIIHNITYQGQEAMELKLFGKLS